MQSLPVNITKELGVPSKLWSPLFIFKLFKFLQLFQALSQHSEHLAVTQLRWLGIHPTDVAKFAIPTIPFTNRDLAKVQDLVSRPYIQQNEQLLEQVK